MSLLAIPNVSEGRDARLVARLRDTLEQADLHVLDVHVDGVHNRSVLTAGGQRDAIVRAAVSLAEACSTIDLSHHYGVHPRLGGLDVFPVVPHHVAMDEAVDCARAVARAIGHEVRIPVYLYGAAARRKAAINLPDLRRGGLERLIERAKDDLPPDEGPADIDPSTGVVCVGARGPLIAFNVVVDANIETARDIARAVRNDGNMRGVRALAFPTSAPHESQISMNLTEPDELGIDEAFALVEKKAHALGGRALSTEIVGLVEQRFLPAPNKKAARLMSRPGRSVEASLRG